MVRSANTLSQHNLMMKLPGTLLVVRASSGNRPMLPGALSNESPPTLWVQYVAPLTVT